MRYAYTHSPLSEAQQSALRAARCDIAFVDQGLKSQPEFEKMLALLAPGDEVVVAALEHLAPGLERLLQALGRLSRLRVDLVSLDGTLDTRAGPGAAFYAHAGVIAACAQAFAVARMQAGRAQARARGQKQGRKPKLNPHQIEHGRKLLALGETGRAVARTLGISQATLYRHLKVP